MKVNFEISKLALKDIEKIWVYTNEQWSIQQANKYHKELFKTINDVCKNPEIGKPLDEVKKGHRRINVKSHMIIYKINKSTVFIDRILHQKMDIDKHLND